MRLILSNQASAVLNQTVGPEKSFILATRKEHARSLRELGPCAKGSFFQIVPIIVRNKFNEHYQSIIHNERFKIYTSKDDREALGERLELEYDHKLNSFILKNEHQILDHNIKLKNYFFS